jgi:hypothetical protein
MLQKTVLRRPKPLMITALNSSPKFILIPSQQLISKTRSVLDLVKGWNDDPKSAMGLQRVDQVPAIKTLHIQSIRY